MDRLTERPRTGRRPLVSLIIPSYNDAANLARTLPMLRSEFGHSHEVEVIVVDDGSNDHSAQLITAHLQGWAEARLIRLPWNQGKGAAVKAGVNAVRGERFVFMDADLSADLADLPRLLAALNDADIALGSRSIAGSRVDYQQPMRQLQSKFFNSVACVLTHVVASDTQCGFKAFRTEPGKLLFHLSEGKGFAFDVEVLALAQLLDMRIVEVPIHWVDVSGSSVRAVRDPFLMMRDILRTRRRCRSIERKLGRRVVESVRPVHDLDAQLRELLHAESDTPFADTSFADTSFADTSFADTSFDRHGLDVVRDDEKVNGFESQTNGYESKTNGVESPANGRRTAPTGLA